MGYRIICQSQLLQHTLEYFLKDHIDRENGVIITDNPEINGILIGKDIKKPFSKTTLFMQLEKQLPVQETTLEEKIDAAFAKFKKELIEILKEHNGEK
jgi:hypothetical protein